MKILITGGAGFIGSNLVDHFLSLGYKVVCLDNLSTGFEHNISHHFNNPNLTFIRGDIREFVDCKKAIAGCNSVLHQAALGSVPRSIADPITTSSVNISGFLNVLVAARDEKVNRFVYAVSSSTYGDSPKLPKVENEIGKPLSPYAITKYTNELLAEVFAKTYGMQCIGLRYFNVFGKRQDINGVYAGVIPLWTKQLFHHESPTINGDGSYSRDFTYIENVVQANEKALLVKAEDIAERKIEYIKIGADENKIASLNPKSDIQKESESTFFSEVFNIAYGTSTSLIELYNLLRNSLAKFDSDIMKLEPKFGPYRVGDVQHSQASILKGRTMLGYDPEINLQTGIDRTVEWYYNNLLTQIKK